MKREFSAGGVVYKKSKVKSLPRSPRCEAGQQAGQKLKVHWLVVQHSQHKGWVFPKGLIGDTKDGESKEETAIREVKEEGGVEAKILAEIPPVNYWYVFEGEKVFKTVYYFLMEYLNGDITSHDWEVSESKWLNEEEVKKTLTYKSDKIAFANALKIFQEKCP